jgi:hypothetical protein
LNFCMFEPVAGWELNHRSVSGEELGGSRLVRRSIVAGPPLSSIGNFTALCCIRLPFGASREFCLSYTPILYSEHCTALHCTALHCTALHIWCLRSVGQTITSDQSSLQWLPRHCTALHCTALHCTALHCTINQIYSRPLD